MNIGFAFFLHLARPFRSTSPGRFVAASSSYTSPFALYDQADDHRGNENGLDIAVVVDSDDLRAARPSDDEMAAPAAGLRF